MSGVSFLISFLNNGANQLVTELSAKKISPDLPSVIVGTILFFIVGCEFFINYKLKFRTAKGGKK